MSVARSIAKPPGRADPPGRVALTTTPEGRRRPGTAPLGSAGLLPAGPA